MSSFANLKLLPEAYRALSDGVLSICVDRFGGIDELGWLTGPVVNGVEYYDPFVRKLMSRACGKSLGRPLFGPAMRFLSEAVDGRIIEHYPANPEIFPWALRGKDEDQSYLLMVDQGTLLMRFGCRQGRKFHLVFNREHLSIGQQDALPNIWNDEFNRPYHEALHRQDVDEPFANGPCQVTWHSPLVSADHRMVTWEIDLQQPYGDERLVAVLATDRPLVLKETRGQWMVDLTWDRRNVVMAMGFGREQEATQCRAREGVEHQARIVSRKFRDNARRISESPEVSLSCLPSASSFFASCSVFQPAMLLPGGGIRAASHKYGYYAMWDAIYPIRDFLWLGRYEQASALWHYTACFPSIEVSPFAASQLILAFAELRAQVPASQIPPAWYQRVRELFETAVTFADPERGLVRTLNACGVDRPAELGLGNFFYAACTNAWWYSACRTMENLAIEQGDGGLEERAHRLQEKVFRNYLPTFWNQEEGFVAAGVPLTAKTFTPVFHNSATIGMDYGYGAYLFQEVTDALAEYLSRKLYHPLGHSAVSWDSQAPCEMWKYVHMNQHLAHECKLLRQAGKTEEIKRTLRRYLEVFDRYGVAQETFNFNGCEGNETQTANWQTFSAASAAEAIRYGIMGLGCHEAGWFYIPAPDSGEVKVRQWKSGGHVLNFHVTGTGAYADLTLNGQPVKGTLQISHEMMDRMPSDIEVVIQRRSRKPSCPVLLNSFGGRIRILKADTGALHLAICQEGCFPLAIWSPRTPVVTVNECPAQGHWNERHQIIYMDGRWHCGDRLEVRC